MASKTFNAAASPRLVPGEMLQPRNTWTDKAAYDAKAAKVASLFRENFKKYEGQASPEVRAGGPKG